LHLGAAFGVRTIQLELKANRFAMRANDIGGDPAYERK